MNIWIKLSKANKTLMLVITQADLQEEKINTNKMQIHSNISP